MFKNNMQTSPGFSTYAWAKWGWEWPLGCGRDSWGLIYGLSFSVAQQLGKRGRESWPLPNLVMNWLIVIG